MFSGVICADENVLIFHIKLRGIIVCVLGVLCCLIWGGCRILEIGTHCMSQFPATGNPSAKLEFIAEIVAFIPPESLC